MVELYDDFNSSLETRLIHRPKTKTVYFKFNTRIISATGTQADRQHPDVLRLKVNASIWEGIIQTITRLLLPAPLGAWLRSAYPEWFLPARIVLKREMDDHPQSFDTERTVYERLQPIQGRVVPRLLGQIEYDGGRALVLADIGGVCLADPAGGMVLQGKGNEGERGRELGRLLEEALGALAAEGVSHDDTKLDNFHLVGEGEGARIMVVDFELVDLDLSGEDAAWVVRANAESLVKRWTEHLECLREDGLLPREGVA